MFLAEKSRINLLYLICSKEIINAGRFKKSAGVRHLINWDLSFCFIASFAFVLQRHRAKPIPLILLSSNACSTTHWVFIDILSACFIIISITHNMFSRGTLKHFFYSKFLLTATRSQRLKCANHIIQGREGACSSRFFMEKDNCMDMVGHNNIIFNGYTRKSSLNQL